jgi:predicted amidohydrolase YtcJ
LIKSLARIKFPFQKQMTVLLTNANIYTLTKENPTANSIAIAHGRILAVGDLNSIMAEFSKNEEVIDLQGRTVLPGLIDAHIHLEQYALFLEKLDCETRLYSDCLQSVFDRAKNTPDGQWILGHGWNQNEWEDHQGFPSAADLDTVSPRNPVYLTAKSLHVAWANSAALTAAGINFNSPDPPGGRIGRDQNGNPDGLLFENAMTLISQTIPKENEDHRYQAIISAQQVLWSMGITGVHDFDGRQCFQTLQTLHDNQKLNLRVIKSIPLEDMDFAINLGLRSGFGDDFLRIGSIKAFSDGALGPRTAAMLSPYQGEPQNQGMLLLDAEELYEHGRKAVNNGLSLAVHAIGDRANHEVLNAFAQLRLLENEIKSKQIIRSIPLRHRIEHVQIIHPQDTLRLAPLGIIASMQPIHVTSDFPAADRYWGDRTANAYAWRSILQLGTQMTFGSDAPVESPNPFWGLHSAVTRRRQDGSPGPEGWHPEQRLNLIEALLAYTTGAAFAAKMEVRLGQISPGYLADLLILDTDPFQVEVDNLYKLKPVGTMVNGKFVYRNFG